MKVIFGVPGGHPLRFSFFDTDRVSLGDLRNRIYRPQFIIFPSIAGIQERKYRWLEQVAAIRRQM